VSRKHAKIELRGNSAWWIVDLKSTNGVKVNGNLVAESLVNPGDQILIGSVALELKPVPSVNFSNESMFDNPQGTVIRRISDFNSEFGLGDEPVVARKDTPVGVETPEKVSREKIFQVLVQVAKAFLNDAKIAFNRDSEFNQHYAKALDAAADGKWPVANDELNRANAMFPSSPDLLRVRNDINRAMQAMPVWERHPFAATAAVIGTLGIIAALTLPFLSRRRLGPQHELLFAKTVEMRIEPNGGARSPNGTLGRLTILNGERAGEKLGLGGSGIRIGRESTICEIVLENPKVSRLHAEVVSIDGKVLLIDRNSSNGTYVNDQKIDKRFLKDGDIIYFGGRNAVAVAFNA
jgi:pSer/pThr/pTyr-binding forkhead associated (FHA) protein